MKKAILQRTDVEGINAENNGTLEGQTLVPGMSLYYDIEIDSGSVPRSTNVSTQKFSQVLDAESQASGDPLHE